MVLLLSAWLQYTPGGLLGKADAVGYAVCHRIPSHSFKINGRPLSLCARCSGQYLGVALGLFYLAVQGGKRSGKPPWAVILLGAVSFLAYALDGVNSFLSLYPGLEGYALYSPRNELRLLSGMGLGLGVSIVVAMLVNRAVWREVSVEPVLSGFWPWMGFYALGAAAALGVTSGVPFLLYALTMISVSGVLLLLTVLYGLLWLILLGNENTCTRLGELTWYIVGGFATAVVQIALLDILRYLATGTWSGFHLG